MIGHEMAAAFAAILPLAHRRLLERGDMLGAAGDAHRLGLPEREGVHRAARPGAAGAAMAIAHRFRRAGRFEMDGAAETFAFVCRHGRELLSLSDGLSVSGAAGAASSRSAIALCSSSRTRPAEARSSKRGSR